MKKLLLFSAIALFLSAMGGCEKEEVKKHSECQGYSDTEKKKVFVYNFRSFIKEGENITIYYKSKHSKISDFDDNTIFNYQPEDSFIGTDTVGIAITDKKGRENYIAIMFHITQCGMLTEMNTNL